MFNITHQYDLAFLSPNRKPRTPPELIFIIDYQNLTELRDRLYVITGRNQGHLDKYFYNKGESFTLPDPDLFGNIEFGFGKCGYGIKYKDELQLCIQLGAGEQVYRCTQTIYALSKALGVPFEKKTTTNKRQQLDLSIVADFSQSFYGYAVGGRLSESVTTWLSEYAKAHTVTSNRINKRSSADMPPAVIKAMRETWFSIHTGKNRSSAKECRGNILLEGYFTLICLGNACDLSVYPDQRIGDGYGYVELGCHNLDTAYQQLTLLAGIAKICELARKSS